MLDQIPKEMEIVNGMLKVIADYEKEETEREARNAKAKQAPVRQTPRRR